MLGKFSQKRRRQQRPQVLKTTTIREFNGGWNVVDNDLNLSSQYSKILTNIRRDIDGSQSVRWGTRMLAQYSTKNSTTGTLETDPFNTGAIGSTRIVVDHADHGLIAGHTVTFAGVILYIDGIPPEQFNTTHTVAEVIDENTYVISTTNGAIAGNLSGGGSSVTFSHNNKVMGGNYAVNVTQFQDRFVIVSDDGSIIESDDAGNSRTIWNNAIAGAVGYQAAGVDSLATVAPGESRVRWTKASHGLTLGTTITFRGATGFDDIDAAELNTTVTVTTVVDANTVEFEVASDVALVGGISGGGSSIEYTLAPISGWGTINFCSFERFNGRLIVSNGIDKPLEIDLSKLRPCDYLVDAATGSNYNVPVCRYMIAMDDYLVMAGDLVDPFKVHISALGAAGTWAGDPAPNDATSVNIGQVTTSQDTRIRGLSRYRDKVVVAMSDVQVYGTLGTYNEDEEHVPDFGDEVKSHGTIAHNSMVNLGNDLLMMDHIGVPSIARAQFVDTIRPERVSELIDPEIQASILRLSVGTTNDRVFSIYDQRNGECMFFVPNNDDRLDADYGVECYVFKFIPTLKVQAWAKYEGWNWDCGCRSLLGRVFFMRNKKLYVLGATEDPVYSDFVDDPDIDEPDDGEPINFVWELPWSDFDRRMHTKTTKYIAFDTKGTAQFNVKMFVDNIYNGVTGVLDEALAALSMNFVGGDAVGFGGGDQPFGGGRQTSDERLYAWPAKFKIMKLRITGSVSGPLKFVAVTLGYHDGGIRR